MDAISSNIVQKWIDNVYLPTNRSRMQEAHRYITNKLKTMKVPFLSHGSGLYIWVNLKEYLDPCTFEEEQLLYRRFLDNKLLLAPGKAYMCKEPGWFRLTFTDNPLRLKVAMQRFSEALTDKKQNWIEKQLEDALVESVSSPSTRRSSSSSSSSSFVNVDTSHF
ncbi:PREDICTED: probable inactive 1-aminocyclopropane-1-carboxylate synthase-like protein 2 [Myotis brandtii]|uniref:probable inactive 1-aminocyclopropane-1-carboxylate synthase-like protein 2 n=1 Tax=Myotis brandtii TaxID=109478 RepID=UPI00070418ED|nr:PREDICTED: probable inactive 1-aminocyclopropane-1-carboxylate synthase-like protein 2 [Myotis brandtii]